MIHVDRARVPPPRSLRSPAADEERRAAISFFARYEARRQTRFEFGAFRQADVGSTLMDLFYSKCAYCERRLRGEVYVDMYRPITGIAERPEHPGYWWLGAEWTNMLPSCGECSAGPERSVARTSRGNRFPLEDEDRRALAPGMEDAESPLLLDPCRDAPEEHLVFDVKGTVASSTRRGQASITLFSLNRPSLVRERFAAAQELAGLLDEARDLAAYLRKLASAPRAEIDRSAIDAVQRVISQLGPLTDDPEEFAGFKRQLVRPIVEQLSELGLGLDAIAPSTPSIPGARKTTVKRAFAAYQAGSPISTSRPKLAASDSARSGASSSESR